MTKRKELTQVKPKGTWKVILNTGSTYGLSDKQAEILKKAILDDERGIVVFDGFIISIPYIVDFFRVKGRPIEIGVVDDRTSEEKQWDKLMGDKNDQN